MFDDPAGTGVSAFPSPGLASHIRPSFVVAIPVRDEEERLPACLRALARQRDRSGRSISPTQVRVVLFANNCTDRSASLARNLGGGLSLDVPVVEARLPPASAHAGSARRAAMDLAEAWLVEAGERDGVILATDADSQVSNWIAENLAAFAAGAEAVLGRINLDEEAIACPRRSIGVARSRTHTRSCSPNCRGYSIRSSMIRGPTTRQFQALVSASLAQPIAALVAYLLLRHGVRIRHCPTAQVVTSGRTDGRAPGGVADTLAIRSKEPDAFRDEALEPFRMAFARAAWRACLRRRHGAGRLALDRDWAEKLEISPREVDTLVQEAAFGAILAEIELRSPLFARRLLRPAELPE